MIERAVYSLLSSNPEVTGFVADGVFPLIAPQGTRLPYVTYQRVATETMHTFDGADGLVMAQVEVNAIASTYKEAKDLSQAAHEALQDFNGVEGMDFIEDITRESQREDHDAITDAGQKPVYRVSTDYNIWFDDTAS